MSGMGRSATRCEQDCTIKEWPHAGPCEVQRYMDAPGRSTSPDRREIERDVLTHVMRDLPLGTDLPSALWGASRALICTRDTEDTDA